MKKSVAVMYWACPWKAAMVLFFSFMFLLPSTSYAISFSYESIVGKYDARGINDSGDIVGATYLLTGGSSYDLNPLPNGESGAAYGVNNSGRIVGWYADATSYIGTYDTASTSYTEFNEFQYEHPTDGFRKTYAHDVNSDEWIVGMARYGGDSGVRSHAFLRKGDTFSIIDFPGYDAASANGINDLGQIVGTYFNTDDDMWKGFFYDEATSAYSSISVTDSIDTKLHDINDDGWIIGEYTDPGDHRHGFVKIDDVYTEMIFPDAVVTIPYAINSDGWVVGNYFKDGRYNAFLAKPGNNFIPEPTTLALMGLGLAGIGYGRQRSKKSV